MQSTIFFASYQLIIQRERDNVRAFDNFHTHFIQVEYQ